MRISIHRIVCLSILALSFCAAAFAQQSQPALTIGRTGAFSPDQTGIVCNDTVNISSIFFQYGNPSTQYSGPWICIQTGDYFALRAGAYKWVRLCFDYPTSTCAAANPTSVGVTGDGVLLRNINTVAPISGVVTLPFSLLPQVDHTVLAGPTTGGPTSPTFRQLSCSDLSGGCTGSETVGATGDGTLLASIGQQSPVMGAVTLPFALNTQSQKTVLAGPTSGGAALPTFRQLACADLSNAGPDCSGATHECYIIIGADNGDSLTTADIAPQGRQCFIPLASTVIEVTVAADAGTPAVVVAVNHAGTLTSLNTSLPTASAGAPACANVSGNCIDGTTPASSLSATAIAAGDWRETRTSASASTAKRMSITITYRYN